MLDSLKSQRKAAANTIKDYLVMEAKEKKNIYLNKSKCRVIYANTPTQPNHYDCGVYVLKFVEKGEMNQQKHGFHIQTLSTREKRF
ncbi:hypothetical protein EDD86DRAFT_249396 [Gorgonomyces haynaldii]|nr:hypothetical protein EDD86DRAFT_249396 [Gorgonomyces haynaldii]